MSKQKLLVGIVGLIGSGKDTVADRLVNYHGFHRESFAGTLKDAVSSVFSWDRQLLEGKTDESRKWREQVDQWWSTKLNLPNLTPRFILQQWGTDVCRAAFHDDIWIASLENKIINSQHNIVVSDCRFFNEIKSIRQAGGVIIRVQRGQDPEWYNYAVKYNTSRNFLEKMIARHKLKKYNIHSSEYSWIGADFDYVINNNGGLIGLYAQIEKIVNQIGDCKLSS